MRAKLWGTAAGLTLAAAGTAAYVFVIRPRSRRSSELPAAVGAPAGRHPSATPMGLMDRTRQFNKRYFNRLALKFAGRRRGLYGILKHVGRRSGKDYATPVVVARIPGGFLIPMPYGAETDWLRNLLAAGRGILVWDGREYAVEGPEVVEQAVAFSLLPPGRAPIRAVRFKLYARLRERAAPPEGTPVAGTGSAIAAP
jgi:deazaflavin-dependent oxidoreductase (nitroreductase family)